MGTVTKAKTLKSNKAHSVYIVRGRHCDAEMARQPALVRAIKTEMASQEFRVRVEFNKSSEFLERYPDMIFLALCCLGKIPGGAPFSQLHKSGNGSRVDRP